MCIYIYTYAALASVAPSLWSQKSCRVCMETDISWEFQKRWEPNKIQHVGDPYWKGPQIPE